MLTQKGGQTMLYSRDEETPDCLASDDEITRRDFCNRLALISAGTVVAATSVAVAAGGQQQKPQKHPTLVYPPQKIEGAESLMPGSALFFTYPSANEPAILVRTNDGQYFAYSQRCTHLGCSVYFDRARRSLECPCHKGAYDVQSGYMLYGPPQRPLDQISLQMRAGGEIWATGKRAGSIENFA
jgi:Rieske Fe-S protein